MLKLDKRLAAIASEVDAKCLADIGADHGKVVVFCLNNNKAHRAYAVDISQKSLQKARLLAEKHGVADKIKFVVGDGLQKIDNDADCIVIAGMGGFEIIKILSQRKLNAKYILAPHQDAAALRRFLNDNAFFVQKDYFVAVGKRFYDIIVCVPGKGNYTENEIYVGKNIPPQSDFQKKLTARKSVIMDIYKKTNNPSEEIKKELGEINNALQN